MNLALSAIIIFILLLPGAAVLFAYYSSTKSKGANREIPITDLLGKGLVWSFFLHTTSICILHYFFDKDIRFGLLYKLVNGSAILLNDKELTKAFQGFALYHTVLLLVVWGATKKLKKWIYRNKWDIRYRSLQITNYWYHVFSARYLEGDNIPGELEDTDLIFLDILVDTEIIYSGFLKDFNYSSRKDELENIILSNVFRTPVDGYPKRYNVDGDIFLIPKERIVNLKISYLKFSRV